MWVRFRSKMFLLLVVVIAISGALALPAPDGRIVGGTDAAPGQYTYQISMQHVVPGRGRQHFCGGSIINAGWILCAAHCVIGNSANDFVIVAGITDLREEGQVCPISQMLYHGNYDPQTMQYDISLIQLAQPLQFNALVQPVSLASSPPAPGTVLVLSGWGLTSYPGQRPPDRLQQIGLTSISTAECQSRAQGAVITDMQQCTLEPPGRGACQGDSGGPLMANGQQVGVVSWGMPCARGAPDVFTSVPAFIGWINSVIG